jgi:hypothetical protein
MTVEITSPPTRYNCVCNNCGAGLSYGATDLRRREFGGRTVRRVIRFVDCPLCGGATEHTEHAKDDTEDSP